MCVYIYIYIYIGEEGRLREGWAPLVQRYFCRNEAPHLFSTALLSNAANRIRCIIHHSRRKACVRQAVLDKWLPLIRGQYTQSAY